jgi:teichoic acid transport system ATP-binding protein
VADVNVPTQTTPAAPRATVLERPSGPPPAPPARVPTVVVDDVHITYRLVSGGGRSAINPVSALKRIVTGSSGKSVVKEVQAVKGVSLIAYEGEAVGLIGSNGSGKSTLLRAVAGLLPVNRGAIYTKGQPSLLGVNAALLGDLDGYRNAVLGCLAMGMNRTEALAAAPGIIEFSGINERGDFASLPMSAYSSGMQARLRFAIASTKKHDVLLIDEALATGDTRFRRKSEKRVKELQEGAGTIFLVSHSAGTIRDTCHRTIWLESGVIRADGETNAVVDEYEAYMAR